MMRRPMRTYICLLSAGLMLLGCATTPAGEAKGPAQAADFTLRSVEGKNVRLADHLGKDVIVLSFWATWCTPCLGEMPQLQRIYEAHKAEGLTVMGVSMDGPESVANVEPTIRRYGVTYPVLLDEETRVTAIYNPTRDAPFTVVIDRAGRIVETKLGYTPGDEVPLEQQLVRLLAAPGATP